MKDEIKVERKGYRMAIVNCKGVYYRDLNARLRGLVEEGVTNFELSNVCGQRYIGTDLDERVDITIFGTPGNDLGAFMAGPRVTVFGNAQDGCGNTMDDGLIVVHGHAGDITGLSARGGKIFIRDYVGYRAGIHMKEYKEKKSHLVIGNTAQDFVGEYMAGGVLVILGLNLKGGARHKANFIGTGMHGGVIYLRGTVENYQLGKEVAVSELEDSDNEVLAKLVVEYCSYFGGNPDEILAKHFYRIYPRWLRPYGRLYAY